MVCASAIDTNKPARQINAVIALLIPEVINLSFKHILIMTLEIWLE
jgi:hypothetical protein